MVAHKVALLTDSHFGAHKSSQHFHNYFEKFYKETFFPTIDKLGIKTIIHLGDCFDVRKSIDYWSLDWSKRVFFDEVLKRDIQLEMIVGNHDIFYKAKLDLNAQRLNLKEYPNIRIWDTFGDITELGIFMCPWVCEGNVEEFMSALDKTTSPVCMGHLELSGFYANKTAMMNHGMDPACFWKFDKVFSGHYHMKSSDKNINYLGNPYQMYWNDEGDTRGFHIFDVDTQELEFIPNPNTMFQKVYFNKDAFEEMDFSNKFVKLIIDKRTPPATISYWVDKIYDEGVYDLKVIDNTQIEIEDDIDIETEDTLTTLSNYVKEMDDTVNKESVIEIFKALYVEAHQV